MGGKEFDTNSNFNQTVPKSQYYIITNEYDFTRAHVSFFMHYPELRPTTITFDLCCFLSRLSEWSLYEYHELGRSVPSLSSSKDSCEAIQVTFTDELARYVTLLLDGLTNQHRYFILKAGQEVTLDRCPEGSWIVDTELKLEIVTQSEKEDVSNQTLISAIVGAIVFTMFIAISVFYYRQKHKNDLEWKAMKEREAMEAEISD